MANAVQGPGQVPPRNDAADLLDSLLDPVGLTLLEDPCIDPHGHTFSRAVITQCLTLRSRCPVSNTELHARQLVPNRIASDVLNILRRAGGLEDLSARVDAWREEQDPVAKARERAAIVESLASTVLGLPAEDQQTVNGFARLLRTTADAVEDCYRKYCS